MKFKKIVLRSKQDILYEDNNGKIYKELTHEDFNDLLEKLNFNNDFALPDKLVQDFVNDDSIMPTFKRSLFFNHYDMEELVKNIKPYHKKRNIPKKNTKKNTNKKTPKRKNIIKL